MLPGCQVAGLSAKPGYRLARSETAGLSVCRFDESEGQMDEKDWSDWRGEERRGGKIVGVGAA